MEGCDGLIHAAAMYEVGIPAKQHPAMYEANVRRHRAGAEGRRRRPKVAKIVYVSTVGIFGNTHGKVVDESYEHPGKEFTSYYEETKLEAPPDRQADDEVIRPGTRRSRRRPCRGCCRMPTVET